MKRLEITEACSLHTISALIQMKKIIMLHYYFLPWCEAYLLVKLHLK